MDVGFWERLLQEESEPQILLFVDRDDEHRVLRVEQLAGDLQTAFHEGQPLRVPVVVVAFDVVVVVLPVLRAGVVRRVYVDRVDRVPVRVGQHLERVEVLSVDDSVERLVDAALHPAGLDQPREDAVAELRHYHEVIGQSSLGF